MCTPLPVLEKEKNKHSENGVEQLLDNAVSSGQQILPCVVRQILEECQSDEDEPCRKAVFEFCVKVSNGTRINSAILKEVFGKLLHEVNSLKGSSLVGVAELIIKGMKGGSYSALELFPKVLSAISTHKIISYLKDGGGYGEMEGSVQKSHLINTLCSCRWDPSCVLHIADMCKDISMTSEELEFLIQKFFRVMKTLNHSELPPLVYQLLLLSNNGHKALVLEGIQALFNQLDQEILNSKDHPAEGVVAASGGAKELLQTEGTVILHISFALKQGQDLRKEYLKSLEAIQARLSSIVLSPFSVALSLSVSRIHRFENEVLKFLKEVVIKSFKDEERRKASKWVQASEVCEDLPDVDWLLMDIVERSSCGWDHVLQGLVMLGFNLMELYSPKSTNPTIGTPQHKACSLGSRLLLKTFEVHQIVQEEVLSQIVSHILTNASGYVGHYISLLSRIVDSSPHVAQDPPVQLKEVFAYLNLLSPSATTDLLHAMLPLVQYNAAIRDSLILVLRKSLFSRQVQSRKIAVEGYLLLLKNFIVLEAVSDSQLSQTTHSTCSSQVTVEVHSGPSTNGALCLEILGTLRRSLTKQSDIRLSLYQGLYPVFCANASLAEPIVDILVGHFQTYYEIEQDITPPIKLEHCISASGNDVVQIEPLDGLVKCLQLCVTKFLEQEDNDEVREIPPIIEEAQDILQSLVERMAKSEPEDFELDKSSDVTASSSVGQKNRSVARLVMGVYEAVLEYTFITGEFSQESCDQTLKLFLAYHRIATIIQEKSASGGATTSKRGPVGNTQSRSVIHNLSLCCVIRLLKALFCDSLPNHQQPLSVLRDSTMFVKYVVNAALQNICQLQEHAGYKFSTVGHPTDKVFKQCCDLGKILFNQVETCSLVSTKKDKGKSNSLLCLEGFHQLLLMMITWFSPSSPAFAKSQIRQRTLSLHDFLVYVNPALRDKDSNELIHYLINFFEGLVVGVLDGHSREWSIKDLQLMINDIAILSKELDSETLELKETFEWAYMQCKDRNVDDGPLTKTMVSLMLTLNARHKGSIKIIGKLAKDVHYHLGDIDEEVELEGETSFAIVNPHTAASSILNLIYTHIDTVICDAEWLINRLKSEVSSNPAEAIFEGQKSLVGTQSTDFCAAVCDRLIYVVSACSELVQTSLSPGPTVDGMFKVVTKLFSVLSNLTRYNLSVYSQTYSVLPSFKKLVSLVGKDLCQQIYSSISYAQSCQSSLGEAQADKGKKGEKKKGKTLASGKASIRREIRSVPNLIYAIEQLEKFLIKLDKKAKINLMESFKRSTARDFRINTQLIDCGVEKEESGESSGQEDEMPPKAKRMKRN